MSFKMAKAHFQACHRSIPQEEAAWGSPKKGPHQLMGKQNASTGEENFSPWCKLLEIDAIPFVVKAWHLSFRVKSQAFHHAAVISSNATVNLHGYHQPPNLFDRISHVAIAEATDKPILYLYTDKRILYLYMGAKNHRKVIPCYSDSWIYSF